MKTLFRQIYQLQRRKIITMVFILASYVFFLIVTFLDISRGVEFPLLLQASAILAIGASLCLGYVDIRESNNFLLIGMLFAILLGFLGFVMINAGGVTSLRDLYHWHIAAVLLLITAMITLVYFKWVYHINSVHVRSRTLMHSGMGMYGLISSAVLACLIVATYPYIPFDCDQLQEYSSDIVSALTDPVSEGIKNTQSGVGVVTDFLSQDIGSLVLGDDYGGNETLIENDNAGLSQIDQSTFSEAGYSEDGDLNILTTQEAIGTGTGLVGYVESFKSKWIDQLVSDQQLVNSSICEGVIELLVEKWNDGGLKLSVIVILFALLSPVMSTIIIFLTVFCFIIFIAGKRLRIRRIRRVLMEVEEVV